MNLVLLCGGIGGSKLALGLYQQFPHANLSIIVNTADDVDILGLHVSPDLDTLIYTLAGLANRRQGWGIQGDTFQALDMLKMYGHEAWFRLGDRDIATHLARTHWLRQGLTLSETADRQRRFLNVSAQILPMTNDPVRSSIETHDGWIPFQDYFVRLGYTVEPTGVRLDGIDSARAPTEVFESIARADRIIVAPSNPVVSIGPILAVPGLRDALVESSAPIIAVSPIVGSQAVTGPAAQLMKAVGMPASACGVGIAYQDFLDLLVVDASDSQAQTDAALMGIEARATNTIMSDARSKRRLARFVVEASLS